MKSLDKYKILVCVGTGGVGKTTIAASLGELMARRGKKALVLTIDPARRLATALGCEDNLEEMRVQTSGSGELWAAMIEPAKIFDRFVERASPNAEHAQKLLKNRLYLELSRSLNGSQEFTSLERLLEAEESKKYDVIILDTPPSQHAIDFLRAPERIFSLFQDSITRWFIDDQKSQGLFKTLFHRGTQTVLGALKRITGAQFIGELSEFFLSMSFMQRQVAERSIRVHRLLGEPTTGFILVTGFDEAKLKEAKIFARDLNRAGYHLSTVIINRAFPDGFQFSQDSQSDRKAKNEFTDLYLQLRSFYAERIRICDEFADSVGTQTFVLKIPDFHQPVYGLDGLHEMSLKLEKTLFFGDAQ